MRRSASMDRTSLGPLRVRNDENKPSSSRTSKVGTTRKSSSGRSSSGNRTSMGSNRKSMGSRQSVSGIQKSQLARFGQGPKNRLSRGSGIGMRSNGVPKDPRPVSDKSYQHKCIKNVLQFLTERGYPHNINIKILQSPSSKDFFKVFEFIYSFVEPKYKVSSKPEEEIPRIFKTVGYPFMISRSSMFAIGSPHMWPTILAALNFLIEWITYGISMIDRVDSLLFPPEDDVFDSEYVSERQLFYNYLEAGYNSFMDGNDDYDLVDSNLKQSLKQKLLGTGGGMDFLIEENTSLEHQLELLEQDTDRLKAARQRRDVLQHDEERFMGYLNELETHKRQQEQQIAEVEETCANLAIDLESENASILKMQLIYDNQGFTPEDVERINIKRRELHRQKDDIERNCASVEEDIWKEEVAMSKEMEQIETKCQAYNKLAHSLKLIPISAENSCGIDYEMKKPSFSNGTISDFAATIKPALLTLKSQCSESAMRKESEKIAQMEKLEQSVDCMVDIENEVGLLESKYKRAEDEVEAKKQLYQKEMQRNQQNVEDLQNEMVQLNSMMFLSQHDASKESKGINSWACHEKERARKKLREHTRFFKDALSVFMTHVEIVQNQLSDAVRTSERQKQLVTEHAITKGLNIKDTS